MSKTTRLITLLIILALLPSCSLKDAVKRITFDLKKIEMRNVTNEGFTGTIYIQVNNPNSVGLTIKGLRYEAFINGSSAATGRIENPIDIPANGSAVAELPVVASLATVKGGLFGLIAGKFEYSVKGEAIFGKWYGSYTLPFETKKKTMGGDPA